MPTKRGDPTKAETQLAHALAMSKLGNSVMRLKLALQQTLEAIGIEKAHADHIIEQVRAAEFDPLKSALDDFSLRLSNEQNPSK